MRLVGQGQAEHRQRLGHHPAGSEAKDRARIWMQAVSVGEVRLAVGLLQELKTVRPELELILSTGTRAGQAEAAKLAGHLARVVYFPLDAYFSVRRALKNLRPDLVVLVETELWPIFLWQALTSGVKMALVNGRISDKSAGTYRFLAPGFRPLLRRFSRVAAISPLDADRLRGLGVPDERLIVTGNAKSENLARQADPEAAEALGRVLGLAGRPVWVAGSIRSGEESIIIQAFKEVCREVPGAVLVIAPRHLNKIRVLTQALNRAGLSYRRRSLVDGGQAGDSQVVILDTMGELFALYSWAWVALVGGSLAPLGGHNPLEPAYWSKPVLFGPHMNDFTETARMLLETGGASQVNGSQDLARQVTAHGPGGPGGLPQEDRSSGSDGWADLEGPGPERLSLVEAILALEDGTILRGRSFTGQGRALAEVCFNTSMSGYQEVLTDPSYKLQMVAMTYPLIGNYGVNPQDMESAKVQVEAFIVKEYQPFYSNWRATALRMHGALKGVLSTQIDDPQALVAEARNWPGLDNIDAVAQVTCAQAFCWQAGRPAREVDLAQGQKLWTGQGRFKVAAFDYGVKYNILRHLERIGAEVIVLPAGTGAEDVLRLRPDGVFLSNGPGDPAAVGYAIQTVRELIGQTPIFGICLGHQLLGLALGAKTFKLKFGHRGANQPVKDLTTGKVEITAQNHGYCVDLTSLDQDQVELTHINLNDDTLEGFRHRVHPLFCVQYHPENSPGPHDANYLFDRFAEMMAAEAGP
ncbi:MAG: glutamine-hydrolyzing carbamoyl-phosphate synthase small subunit [Deltaproteobacteria bacterium]|nr:glutamine-hydrolyzing carbamoyl-phosphate synthase small subunit [Deltaproteobacteria bacterium]